SLHDNIRFVLSGHDLEPGVSRQTSVRASGTRVHEILSNYQTCTYAPCNASAGPLAGKTTQGGDGYLRIMRFDPVMHVVSVQSFSPYFGTSLQDPEDAFVLPIDL